VTMEKGTVVYDLATDADNLLLLRGGDVTKIPIAPMSAYEAELEDFATSIQTGKATRITPAESALAVEIGLEELRMLGAHYGAV